MEEVGSRILLKALKDKGIVHTLHKAMGLLDYHGFHLLGAILEQDGTAEIRLRFDSPRAIVVLRNAGIDAQLIRPI
jgi:hypothetical protein